MPSQPVTDICANFDKTSVYGKDQHPKGNPLINGKEDGVIRDYFVILRRNEADNNDI